MFQEFIGQSFLTSNENGILTRMIKNKQYHSFILYAPVGHGKTTLANLFLRKAGVSFTTINACDLTLKELKEILKSIENYDNYWLIIDEIHRLDKQQQNLILPYLDNNLRVIGTTSENPYITLNSALRSRVLIFEFKSLAKEEYALGINQYLASKNFSLQTSVIEVIRQITKSDIRQSFQLIDLLVTNYQSNEITVELVNELFNSNFKIDYSDSYHYDLISCLQKSIRASDTNAALYYLACLLKLGDLEAIIRRLGIIAYEDVGLANSNLCAKTINALEYVKGIGLPEGRIILANIVIELAISPKSTSAYKALDQALRYLDAQPLIRLPKQLTNRNFYDRELAASRDNLPRDVEKIRFYEPNYNSKYESTLAKRYEEIEKLHQEKYDN